MSSKKVFIITEAGKGRGLGHLSRCTALCQAFKEKDISPIMIVNGGRDVPKGKHYLIFNWIKRKEKLLAMLKGADIAVLDSYIAPKLFYYKISKIVKLAAYIDDCKRISYPKGLLINGSAGMGNFSRILLRKEFWQVPPKRIRRRVHAIMITFGASYDGAVVKKIIKSISCAYPEIIKYVLSRNASKYKSISDKNIRFVNNASGAFMKKLMLESDIAISACGQTLYELARSGTPTVAIAIARNQYQNLKSWRKLAKFACIDAVKERYPASKLLEAFNRFMEYDERLKFYNKAKLAIDGKGAYRVVDEVLQRLKKQDAINIRSAKKSDCRNMWIWRNHPIARRRSLSNNRISYNTHKTWFQKSMSDKCRKIFIVENASSHLIGQVRFNIIDTRAVISVNLNPKYYNKGFGSQVISLGTKKVLSLNPKINQVIAEIDSFNIASKKAFNKAGYSFIKKETKSARKIDIYKLKVKR
jgi:UDP-2,4-diacetamido-2,4,6-trideoxy-beta-L-altropyranose hydrolase